MRIPSRLSRIITALATLGSFLFAASVSATQTIGERATVGFNTMVRWAYGGGDNVTLGPTTFNSTLLHVVNFLLSFIGLIFFLLMLYAGFLWMTARGNDEQVQKAKKIIRECVTALIIILLARLFTEFLLTAIGQAIEAGGATT